MAICVIAVVGVAPCQCFAAFDYASKLLGVKSPTEFLETSTEHARKQFEVLPEQTKELAELGQKAIRQATEPLKAGAAKAFRPIG